MRVLFVPQWYPPKGHNSGRGTFCREHVRAASLYDEVAVLAYSSRPDRWPTLAWERVDDAGIPTFYGDFGLSPIPRTTLPFFRWYLKRAISRVIHEWGRPDVIHTQDSYAYYVMRSAGYLRIPFVISQHWTAFMRRTLSKSEIRRYRWSFAQAAVVLPVNRYAASDYDAYGIRALTAWLPNALDTEIFYPPEQAEREPWLLHVSGFTAQKRFPDVIRAFARAHAQYPQAVLHVVGEGKGRAEMESLARLDLPPASYRFHGYLAKPELANLMRRARGFVFPSEFETFGCVLMEAMACACPVLTTRVGGIPAVVPEGDGLFVDVGNIEQITHGMVRLLDGSHGLDMKRISAETRDRFSHEAVGRILRDQHRRAMRMDCMDGGLVSSRCGDPRAGRESQCLNER